MAIAFVQVQNNLSTAAGQTSITVNITSTGGNLLVAFVRQGANATDTVTMSDSTSGSNAWSQTASGYVAPTTSGRTSMFYSKTAAGVTSVTASFSTGGGVTPTAIIVIEFSGIGSSPEDSSVNSQDNAGNTSLTSGALTTTNANDVLIFGVACGADETSYTQGTSYTIPSNNVATGANGSNARLAIQYQIVSATQSAVTTSMSFSTNAHLAGIFAAFKASAFTPDEDFYLPPAPQPDESRVTVW